MEEVIWQEHTHILDRVPGIGFGIAIGGGHDKPRGPIGDSSIIILDVVRGGPAYDKLKINDIVISVNGRPMYNMSHSQAIWELKNAGSQVVMLVKRKVVVQVASPRIYRSRSRDLDSFTRERSRSPEYSDRRRYRSRSRSRDLDDRRRRYRSKSRDLDSYRRSRSSRSRTPSRRGRSRGRSYSPRSRSYTRERSPSYRRGRSRSRSITRSEARARSRSRSRTPSVRSARSRRKSRRSTYSRGSLSPSPAREVYPAMRKGKSMDDLHSGLSPLSPDPDVVISTPNLMTFPVKVAEPKTVVLKKTSSNNSYGLKLGTRIFIQDIQPGSLADKNPDINAGDTLLEINGRSVDNKTIEEAIKFIGLSNNKVTMLVKQGIGGTVSLPVNQFSSTSSRHRHRESSSDSESRHSRSRRSSMSKESDEREAKPVATKREKFVPQAVERPKVAPKPEKKQFSGVRVFPGGSAAVPAPSSSSRSTPEPQSMLKPRDAGHSGVEDDGGVLPSTAREIVFVKGKSVGIRLAGGNDVGIFVASVLEGSPAAKKGLRMGDQILSVNDVDFRNIIREEAVLTLMGLPPGENVRITAQPQPAAYEKILEHGTGDSFYIRTHFKYDKSGQHQMSFTRGSTFRISDTLYQGMVGHWYAVRIARNNMEIERGVIPNRSRAEQLKMVQDKKIAQSRDRGGRGISRKLNKNQKAASHVSTASAMFPAYERVVLREAGFKRPVVVFGALADIARARLAADYSNAFEVARNEGVITGQKSNRKGVIRLNTIKGIIEKDKHAILDITPTAVEKLNYAQLYPIVVFLASPSKTAVKELRQKLAATDDEKRKKAGKLYDRSLKLQRGYNHVFTDTIQLIAGSDDWYRKLHSIIRDEQSKPVWVSEDKLIVGAEDTEGGITVPGDDDQLSYVSAPASDYSVTTVGSDVLNTSRFSDEEDESDSRNVRPRAQSSTSSDDDGGGGGEKFDDDALDDALNDEPPSYKPVPPFSERAGAKQVLPMLPRGTKPPVASKPRPLQLQDDARSRSSSSGEDRPPIAAKPPGNRVAPRMEQKQDRPVERFGPQRTVGNQAAEFQPLNRDESEPLPISGERLERDDQSAPLSRPPPYAAQSTGERPQPQQPVYAQVNKNRQQQQILPPHDRSDSTGREYSGETDRFAANEPYRKTDTRPQVNRFPIRDQPIKPPANPSQPKPVSTYQRFAGSSQAKPEPRSFQPYNPPKPTYQRPSAGRPPQEPYREPVSQIRPAQASAHNAPRPYDKPVSRFDGAASREQTYGSGTTYNNAKPKQESISASPSTIDDSDPQVIASASGVFDSTGGVLSSHETGVSIVIPKGAIPPGVRQEIYFKVCRDNALPELDKSQGDALLSPLVMCGPHGLQFDQPVELHLPHCDPSQWKNVRIPSASNNYEVGSNCVSVMIDHF